MRTALKLLMPVALLTLLLAPPAQAAEPNNSFETATGPLNAGKTFKANLEEATDTDFHFFYVPDSAQVTVTVINATEKRGGAADRGRTIVASILRARKGKLPVAVPNSARTLKPKDQGKIQVSLLPGKYFIPVGRTQSNAEPLPDVPFRIRIAPVGVTTDSYEIFEARCKAAHRKVDRIKSSIKRTIKRIAKAKRNDAPSGKIVKLKLKLKDKRAKAKPAKKAEKFACSIPR